MIFKIENKKILGVSGMLSFLYHFPYLLNDWFNVYLLERKVIWIAYVVDFYEEIQSTMLGMICYFHLFSIHFTMTNTMFSKIWTLFSFALIWFLIFKFLKWIFKRKTKLNKLLKE